MSPSINKPNAIVAMAQPLLSSGSHFFNDLYAFSPEIAAHKATITKEISPIMVISSELFCR